jgi:hypothetical protein
VRIGLQRLQAPELVSTPGECGTEQGPALRWQGANLAGPSAFQRCSLRCAELILFRIVFGLRGGTVGCVSRSHFPPDVQADPQIAREGESEQARVAAANALLDRGWGKPRQANQHVGHIIVSWKPLPFRRTRTTRTLKKGPDPR